MTEYVGERDECRERVVATAVQNDLFHVRAAQAAHDGLARHPRRAGQRGLGDVLELARADARDEAAGIDRSCDLRGGFPPEIVPEDEGLQVAVGSGCSGDKSGFSIWIEEVW